MTKQPQICARFTSGGNATPFTLVRMITLHAAGAGCSMENAPTKQNAAIITLRSVGIVEGGGKCYNNECKFFHLYGTKRQDDTNPEQRNRDQLDEQTSQPNHYHNNNQQSNQARTYQQPSNRNHQQRPTDSNQSDRSFLVNMFRDLKDELRKEISGIIKSNLTTDKDQRNQHQNSQATPPQASIMNYQPAPMLANQQATYENYTPCAPSYAQTLQQW